MTSTWKEDMFPATPYLLFDDSKLATHDGYDPSNPLRQRGMLPLHQWANKTGNRFASNSHSKNYGLLYVS